MMTAPFAAIGAGPLTLTHSQVSLIPAKLPGSSPDEKLRSLQEMTRDQKGQMLWQGMKRKQLQKVLTAKNLNDSATRNAQSKKSILEKIAPNYRHLLAASEKFQVPVDILIASFLAENSLATNSKDAAQEGLSMGMKFLDLGGDVHSKYVDYEDKMKRTKACAGLPASKLFLCLEPLIGEPSIPGFGRSYGPAQIDLITASSIADEVGVFDQTVDGRLVHGVFGKRPNSWSQIFQVLDDRIHTMPGSINIIAANMAMATRYYAEKGWDIQSNLPVLVTLQRIGKISQRAAKVSSPLSNNYYPGADAFGVFGNAMIELGIVKAVHEYSQKKISKQDLVKIIDARMP